MNKEMSIKVNNSPVPEQVKENVKNYLREHNLGTLVDVLRHSEYPVDDYLYHVIAKKGEDYSVWTSWNETTQCLNHGHYGLDIAQVVCVHYKYFRTISGENIFVSTIKNMLLKVFSEGFVEKVLSAEDSITEHTFLEDIAERFFEKLSCCEGKETSSYLRECVEEEFLARLGICTLDI